MKVLVAGAQGYIGAVLATTLLDRGHRVVGLDTGFYRDWVLYHEPGQSFPCTARDTRSTTASDVRGFDAVVHLAELSNDPLGHLNPSVTFDINHAGSVRFARACKDAGVPRFIHSSSCSVYGVGAEEDKTEESAPRPQTPYAQCKVLVERDLSSMADDDFSPTLLRNATAYGPSSRMRFDLVLNNLAGWAWTTRQIAMTSDGTPWRPLVHVRDICQAIACVIEAPREAVHNQIFNVGDNRENYRVRDIAEIVSSAFPGCHVTLGGDGGDKRSYRVSFDKLHAHLPQFRCTHSAVDGASELRHLFEQIRLTGEQFECRGFTRVKQLQYLLSTGELDDKFFWTHTTDAETRREGVGRAARTL